MEIIHLMEIILRQFQIIRNSIASHRNCSKTILNCVVTEIQLPLIEIFLTQFQILS